MPVYCEECRHHIPAQGGFRIAKCRRAPLVQVTYVRRGDSDYDYCQTRNRDGECQKYEPKVKRRGWWEWVKGLGEV